MREGLYTALFLVFQSEDQHILIENFHSMTRVDHGGYEDSIKAWLFQSLYPVDGTVCFTLDLHKSLLRSE